MRILLIEDERKLSDNIKASLMAQSFAVDQSFDGEEGLYLAETESYDAIILDLMLPKMDGLEICRQIRLKNNNVPILMLTAKSQLEDKVTGLDAGADDYLTKPFEMAELKSRLNALLRRSHKPVETVFEIEDLVLDPAKHTVTRSGKAIDLTPKEFAILEYLARNKDTTVTRTQIAEHTWDYNFESFSNIIDVFIATIRRKIDKGSKKKLLHTVRGVGYMLSSTK